MNKIDEVIARKNWKFLVKNFLPVNFADSLSFKETMLLVGQLTIAAIDEMAKDGFTADLMRDFAVNLMIILKAKYPNEWNEDWKNEAFLGISCAFVYREDEAFLYIKSAYDKLIDPPQSLIFALISSGSRSEHHLEDKEINELTRRALTKGITYESAQKMAAFARRGGDQNMVEYWNQKAIDAENNQLHTPIITPNILKKLFKLENGYVHEV